MCLYFNTLYIFLINILTVLVTSSSETFPCIGRDFGHGSVVCVCNSTYCDMSPSLQIPLKTTTISKVRTVQIFTSTKSGQRLHKSTSAFTTMSSEDSGNEIYSKKDILDFKIPKEKRNERSLLDFFTRAIGLRRFLRGSNSESTPSLRIIRTQKFQEILGLGGSFTDSSGQNIRKLSHLAQMNLMKSYFGPTGSQYSLGRIPIGGTDFSSRPYTYDDSPKENPDLNLTYFSLQPEDIHLKIPYVKWAETLRGEELRLVGSPWSAPVWMKTNRRLNGAGTLRKKFYQVWADYFVKFIEAYGKEGISIWGVTTGNEPLNGFLPSFPFNCMGWRPTEISQWIGENLGPTLKRKLSKENIQVIMMDDNKILLPTWTKAVLNSNRSSASFVNGVGTHWYLDFLVSDDVMSRFHFDFPNHFILQTEACLGFVPWEREKVLLGSWERGETYLQAIINDMRNWVGGWIDWNLALDLEGGPNWAGWRADAAILINSSKDEFFKQPIYYGISHVSKFVPPGSVRIGQKEINLPEGLQSVAFQRPDNGTVIIFLNKNSIPIKIYVQDEERGNVMLEIPSKAMQSVIYW